MDASIEEYKSVRQESLSALDHVQSVMQYGLASSGFVASLGFVAAQDTPTIGAVVLMVFVPILIGFAMVMMGVAVHRVIQTRRYLRGLEIRLETMAEGEPVMAWERTRALEEGVNGFPFAMFAAIGSAVVAGPGLGGWVLADHDLWTAFVIGEALDIAAAVAFTTWSARTYFRLRAQASLPLQPEELSA
jgi:hypothetical protein